MPPAWRALRRRILTPNVSETRLAVRGFHAKDAAAQQALETVGRSFIAGFGHAAGARAPIDAERELEALPTAYQGFAYEGATMAFALMDGLSLGSANRVPSFLAGRAGHHKYMAHIGIGWAMARLPRWRWRRVQPADPLLGWLVLDGYGFHQAYFHTDRYVRGQYQAETFRWPLDAPSPYANRAIDQGIGRAIWFVEGTDVDRVTATINQFPADRHSDLYSGAGLAATYAGGADRRELEVFWDRAGAHRPVVAQACAFAAKTRELAGLAVPHTAVAASVFCDTTPSQAAAVTDGALVDLPADGDLPTFEIWRMRIAESFMVLGRC